MNTSLKLFFVLALVIPAMLLGQSSPSKIAIVDVQKVFDDYYKVKEAMEKREKSEKIFKDEVTIMENELKKLVDEFKEIQTKLKNPNLDVEALRDQAKQKLQAIRVQESDMKQYGERTRATWRQREQNLARQTLTDIRKAIEKVAADKDLDLVLSSAGQQAVLFAKPAFDVTAEISAILNATKKK